MDWLRRLQATDCRWLEQRAGATEEDISALATVFGQPLPPDYGAFLRFANGARIVGYDGWYVRVWASYDIPSWADAYDFFSGEFPGIMPIADDGGDECIVFDLRSEDAARHMAVFSIPLTSIHWDDARYKAASFHEYLWLRLRGDPRRAQPTTGGGLMNAWRAGPLPEETLKRLDELWRTTFSRHIQTSIQGATEG